MKARRDGILFDAITNEEIGVAIDGHDDDMLSEGPTAFDVHDPNKLGMLSLNDAISEFDEVDFNELN